MLRMAFHSLNVHGFPFRKLSAQPLDSCIYLLPHNGPHMGVHIRRLSLRHTKPSHT